MLCRELQIELPKIEPCIDLLHELAGIGQYAEITRTTDGFFLGRAVGDIGFNEFFGIPSDIAIARTAGYLDKLSDVARMQAEELLQEYRLLDRVKEAAAAAMSAE